MLSNTLNTNEIKDAAGVGVNFDRRGSNNRQTVFETSVINPALPHTLTIGHQESGSGLRLRRRSVFRFDKRSISTVDSVTPVTVSSYHVLDFPIGAMTSDDEAQEVLANSMSFLASLGVTSTILFDGTGNGAVALLNGSL